MRAKGLATAGLGIALGFVLLAGAARAQTAAPTRDDIVAKLNHFEQAAEVAAREIQNLLENKTYAERAAAIGAQVRNEKGTARACDLLGRLLEDPNAEVTNPQLVSQVVA